MDYPDPDGTIMDGGQVISLALHSSTSLVKEDELIIDINYLCLVIILNSESFFVDPISKSSSV